MGFKEILENFNERNRMKKEMFKEAEAQMRVQEILEGRKLSANERELNRFEKEDREVQIKEALEVHRAKLKEEIEFGHNPLNAPNITNHSDFEVLKEKNLFMGHKRNIFMGHEANVMRNNPNLLKNNMRLLRWKKIKKLKIEDS